MFTWCDVSWADDIYGGAEESTLRSGVVFVRGGVNGLGS
jgi:hypothetical protein